MQRNNYYEDMLSESNSNVEIMVCDTRNIDAKNDRFPVCIVWTPIPVLTWLIPIIGHMGIALSNGIIRDFAGPYFVAEDDFAFGHPTKYWLMNPNKCKGGITGWDAGIVEASEIYKKRNHNLIIDNCHSHVARALNIMQYDNSTKWNMVKLAILMLIHSKYVNFYAVLKTWLPFIVIVSILLAIIFAKNFS